MEWIVKAQNRLAQKIKGVMPAVFKGDYIEMRVPPGIHGKEFPRKFIRGRIDPGIAAIVQQIREYGYNLEDVGQSNIYYDEAEDQVWIIDYSHLT